MARKTASLVAENTFCDWISPTIQTIAGVAPMGFLDLIVSGTWSGTLTLQKRHITGGDSIDGYTYSDPFTVESYTDNPDPSLIEDHSTTVQYRIGFATGDYTSGTALVRLEQ